MVGDAFVEAEFGEALEAVGDITDELVDAAFAGKSLGETFGNVLKQMAADWAKSGLRDLASELIGGGIGQKSSGGFFGSLLGSIFGGFRAGGGDVRAGKAYEVGENGREWFVPGEDGTILPHGKTPFDGAAPTGTEAMKLDVDVRAYVDDDGNWQAEVERISTGTAALVTQAGITASQKKIYQGQRRTNGIY